MMSGHSEYYDQCQFYAGHNHYSPMKTCIPDYMLAEDKQAPGEGMAAIIIGDYQSDWEDCTSGIEESSVEVVTDDSPFNPQVYD